MATNDLGCQLVGLLIERALHAVRCVCVCHEKDSDLREMLTSRNVGQDMIYLVMASDHLQHQAYEQRCAHQCPAYIAPFEDQFMRAASTNTGNWERPHPSASQRLRAAVLVRTTFWAHFPHQTLIHHLPIAQWPKQARAGQNRFSLELASPITPSIMHYISPDRSQDQAVHSASLCGFTQLSYPPIHKCCRSS